MAARKRLFFALWPDASLRDALSDIAVALPEDLGRRVPAHNLHLTLLFLGATPAEQLPGLLAAAQRLEGQAFDLHLDHGGWWRRSGIYWLAPREIPAALAGLATRLEQAARALGLDARLGDFRPHVTLMRKVSTPPPVPAFDPLYWPARDFVLAESVTHAAGAEYRELGRWPLRPAAR